MLFKIALYLVYTFLAIITLCVILGVWGLIANWWQDRRELERELVMRQRRELMRRNADHE